MYKIFGIVLAVSFLAIVMIMGVRSCQAELADKDEARGTAINGQTYSIGSSRDFYAVENEYGGVDIIMLGERVLQISENPCNLPTKNLDPHKHLGPAWQIHFVRLPEGDVVVLYNENNKPIRKIRIELHAPGQVFLCP
jgi:hypothetical protein